ncbi:deaminase [Sporolactobacillus sp. KGMB 08714]|uniref:deaminase n=1 Tax=Sporolactobacillus sp. KGMB 08714 TaxID=3064704 RepID=UPI002FBE3EEB
MLDVIPAFKAAGAFSTIGRMGTKGVTTLGDLTKTMSRASGRRLIQLKQAGHAGLNSVKQAAANAGDRISPSGLQPEFAGASGVGGESFVQNVKNTFQKIASNDGIKKASKVDSRDITKNNNQMEINKRYSDIERFRERMGYGKYSSDSGNTVACIKINDETFYGVNSSISYESKMKTIQMRRKWFKEISWAPPKAVKPKHLGYTQSLSHAEAHSLLQAYEKLGKMPSRVTMYVDRPTCGICLGELPIILRHIGVKELIVYSGGRNEPVIIKAIK